MTVSESTPEPPSAKKSRRLYLWLFGLTLVVVVVAIAPFWVRYQRQNAVIEQLFESMATIQIEPVGPRWLQQVAYRNHMLGFYTVTLVLSERSQFTDETLKDIRVFTQLKSLWISSTQVTDSGLVHLKSMDKLEDVRLYHTQVTDNGLLHLRGLTSLRRLTLNATQVTEAGVNELQTALPNCKIVWSNP